MNSDTPETDTNAFADFERGGDVVLADFARKLERERDGVRQALRAANRATMDANTRAGMGETLACAWQENDGGQWATDCGQIFEFTWLDGPTENQFKFCPFCCGFLTPKPLTPEDS